MSILYIITPIIVGLIAGSVLIFSKKYRIIGRIFTSLSIGAIIFFAALFSALITAFGNVHQGFYIPMIFLSALWLFVFIVCAVWKLLKKKPALITLVAISLVLLITLIGVSARFAYIDSIPTVGESENLLGKYAPYSEGTLAADLGEQPSVIFTENLPKMDGATALYPVYSAFARAVYPEELATSAGHYSVVDCTTTNYAYHKITNGEADIIFVAAPSKEQQENAARLGVELIFTPIGREAFVFFVNSQNPTDNITLEEISGIYTGKITKWSELGTDGLGSIRAFQRDSGSGSQTALESLIGSENLIEAPTENVIAGMGGIIEKTADYRNYKNAIGYSFRFYSTEMVKNNNIKLLSVNGAAPTVENIENGTYPLASYFYAVTRSDASENTKRLLEWITSEQGQKLIELTGYTPLER